MRKCGIYCNFSDKFYKKFKKNRFNFFRFKEDLLYISRELIYSGCGIFAVGGTAECYADFLEEFFPWCCVIDRVGIEIINDKDYIDYLINECDYIYVFWNDDENWDSLAERFEKSEKEYDIYEMDSVTDEYRNTDKYLKIIAEEDREALINKKEDIDYLRRYDINYKINKRK